MQRLIKTIAVLLALLLITSSNLIDLAYELINPAPLETIAMTATTVEIEPEPVLASEAKEAVLEMWTITAYCACDICCPGTADNLTANMSTPLEGVTIAADPAIPFGTRVWIEGLGERTVMDRGSAITGNHIDVFFDSHEDAKAFGVQQLAVKVMS